MHSDPQHSISFPPVTPQSLSADEHLYCALLETAPDAIVVVAQDSSIVLVNAQTEQLFDYTLAELVGRPIEMLIPQSAHVNHRGHRAGYVANPSARPMGTGLNLHAVRKDGTVFLVEISLSPVETSVGHLVSAAIRDRTVRKAMEDTIRASNAQLEAVMNASTHAAIIATGLDGRITVFNAGAERMLGHSADEIIGQTTPLAFHLPSEVIARAKQLSGQLGREIHGFDVLIESAHQGGFEDREWTYVRKDGSHRSVLQVVTALRDPAGLTIGYLWVARDITERKQAEDALRRAHEQLEQRVRERTADLLAAQARADLGSWERDFRSGAERWSDEQFRIFGYEPYTIPATYDTFVDALHPEDHKRVLTAVNATLNLNKPYDLECRILRPTGEVRDLHCRGAVSRDETGRPIRMTGTLLDNTERKRFEQTRAHLAAIVASSDDAIVGESLDGIILSWNPAAERLSGYSVHDVIGRPLTDLLPPESVELERAILPRVSRGESIASHESVRVRKGGTPGSRPVAPIPGE